MLCVLYIASPKSAYAFARGRVLKHIFLGGCPRDMSGGCSNEWQMDEVLQGMYLFKAEPLIALTVRMVFVCHHLVCVRMCDPVVFTFIYYCRLRWFVWAAFNIRIAKASIGRLCFKM